jgi:glycosyltransferase involved in cell wall biosynthesis
VYIGQIAPIKGVHVLIRAFRRLRRHGRKVRLIIRGKLNAPPAYDRELRRLAEGDPSIVFGGPYEHRRVLSVLAGAHVVVVPSLWYESATGTVCEGRAARRPVIASRVGGIAEIVNDGVDGLLFERGDVDDLARVMQRLIDEPDLLPHLTSRVTPLPGFEAHFMPDLLRVYEQAIARQAPRDGATPA